MFFYHTDLSSYEWGDFPMGVLGLYGAMNHRNASVALQLTNHFLAERHPDIRRNSASISPESVNAGDKIKIAPAFELTAQDALGLRLCRWPGMNI